MKKYLFKLIIVIVILLAMSGCEEPDWKMETLEEVGTWYDEYGFMTVTFSEGTFTMECNGLGDVVYTGNYRADGIEENEKVWIYNDDASSSDSGFFIEFDCDEETKQVNGLYFSDHDKVKLTSKPIDKITFDDAYTPHLEQAVIDSEKSCSEGKYISPGMSMSSEGNAISNMKVYVYSVFKDMAKLNGDKLDYFYSLPNAEPIEGRLYLSKDSYNFGEVNYKERNFNKRKYENVDDFCNHLYSTSWYSNACYGNPDAQMFNDGYIDVNMPLMTLSSVWMDFSEGKAVLNLGTIFVNEFKGSGNSETSVVEVDDTFVILADYKGNSTVYFNQTYDIKLMYFIEENGMLIQTLVMYNEENNEIIQIANYTAYCDGEKSVVKEFEPKQYEDSSEFAEILENGDWHDVVFSTLYSTYETDVYINGLDIPEMSETFELKSDDIDDYVIENTSTMFKPLYEVEHNNKSYMCGLYITIDSDDYMIVRLALHDESDDTYLFTAHSWTYRDGEVESAE